MIGGQPPPKNDKNIVNINKIYRILLILNLFDNYINSEFNKINILKQGGLTPCRDKKLRLSNISNKHSKTDLKSNTKAMTILLKL